MKDSTKKTLKAVGKVAGKVVLGLAITAVAGPAVTVAFGPLGGAIAEGVGVIIETTV